MTILLSVIALSAYVAVALPLVLAAVFAVGAMRPAKLIVSDSAPLTPMGAFEATRGPARPVSRVSYGTLRGRMGRGAL